MNIIDNVELATRNFVTRKLRTFLTILGISIGIGTVVFLVSLGYGLQRLLIEKIASSDAMLTLDLTTNESSLIKIEDKTLNDIAAMPNVGEVSPQRSVMSEAEVDGMASNLMAYAAKSSFISLGGVKFLAGESFREDKEASVVISSATARIFQIEDPNQAIGKKMKLSLVAPADPESDSDVREIIPVDGEFTIIGVTDDEANSFCFIPIGWTGGGKFTSYDWVKIKVNNQKMIEDVRQAIIEKGLIVSAVSDTVDQANKIFNVVRVVLAVFGIVALVVSAIGMFNTMTITLLEKTVEIGIMKSLGASRKEITFLFLTESVLISFFGGIGGIIIGVVSAELFNQLLNLLAKRMGGSSLDIFYYPLWFLMFIVAFSMLIGFVTGIYPARRAAKLNPLEALRYK